LDLNAGVVTLEQRGVNGNEVDEATAQPYLLLPVCDAKLSELKKEAERF
jgi:hypothetical protein